MAFNPDEWKQGIVSQGEFFLKLFNPMPKELVCEKELLAALLS
jgi:phosphoenolpyruvate carboxykinase (GTP)